MHFRRILIAMAAVASLVMPAVANAQEATVDDPVVTGPIATTSEVGDAAHGYPFLATDYDLAGHGYVEEEFFLSGQATRYAANGTAIATVTSTGHDYATRIVVRRPVDAAAFNGTVITEWYNVSNQWDQEVDWFQTHEHLVRSGYAWVGVSAQRAGLHSGTGLIAWSPDRYGDLDLTDGGTVNDDTLSWDVFSQAVQAIRNPVDTAPLADLTVDHVIATGHSQSAGRLHSYVNSVDPLAGVVDAVVLHGGGGTMRTDITTPVFKINSETDLGINLIGAAQRQPDSEVLRTWEVSGASHGDWKLITDYGRLRIRDIGTAPGGYPGTPQTCNAPSGSRVPQHMVQSTIYDHVSAWVADDTAPPSAPPITLDDGDVVRDELGLGLGGIRLAQQDVPLRINSGDNAGPGFCFLDGSSAPVDDATLADWYPDEDAYVADVVSATAAAMAAGHLHEDVLRDPAWYTDIVELVGARVDAALLDADDAADIVALVTQAQAAADADDLDSAADALTQAKAITDGNIGDDLATATVSRAIASVIGLLGMDDVEPDQGEQVILVTVPDAVAGEFRWTIDGDGSVVLGEMSEQGTYLQATGAIDPIVVTDTRPGGPSWSISGQASDFAPDGPVANHIGWTPQVLEEGAGAVAGPAVASGIDGGDGLSVPGSLASADAGHDLGSARVGADLDIRFPVDTPPGDYTSTLTITALS